MSPPRLPLIQVARDGKIIGEYTLGHLGQALRQKTVLPTDHYWREGKKEWERVRYIEQEAEEEVARHEPPKIPPPPLPGSTINPTYATFGGVGLILLGVVMMKAFQGRLKVVEVGFPTREALVSEGHPIFSPLSSFMVIGGIVLLIVAFWNRKR